MSQLVGDLCKDISTRIGTFVEEFGRLEQGETSTHVQDTRSRRQRLEEVDDNEEYDSE